MLQDLPMILLAAAVIVLLVIIGRHTIGRWHTSRTPSPQVPPELPTQQWLNREADQAGRR